jgi:hypothetical protein
MHPEILILGIEFLIHSVILFALLWIMIKLQKLDYNFLGLLGSAALAGALDMIPHFGHMLAVPVLYLCIWKVTQSSLFPDAAFTVMISYALMFGVNLFIIGSLMGDLRPSDKNIGEDESSTQELAGESQPVAVTNKPAQDAASNQLHTSDAKQAEEIAKQFSIKGVTRNSDKSAVTLQSGKKIYTIFLGQLISVQTDDGLVSVRFTDLGKDWVVLNIRGIQVKCPVNSE